MALAGGSADKAGNVYEAYWTVSEICRLIQDENDAGYIYFEKPDEGKNGFEYVLEKQNKKFYAQVKNYDKNYWTKELILYLLQVKVHKHFQDLH